MIKSLVSLRGIFIIFIFFHHLGIYQGGGTMSVAFFFVLGGFAMTLGYSDKIVGGDFYYRQYLTRRCIKFYPLHWLCLLAVALPILLRHYDKLFLVRDFCLNVVLLQTWIPIESVYFSYNAVSWYLADTMFFAVVFPFIFKWITGASHKSKGVIVAFMVALYATIAILIPEEKYHAILYISPYMRLMDFVFGICLAFGYLKLKEIKAAKSNNKACQIAILTLIVLLVIESCLISENVRLFAPVYWAPVALLIMIASLSERNGGGKFWETNGYNVLAN